MTSGRHHAAREHGFGTQLLAGSIERDDAVAFIELGERERRCVQAEDDDGNDYAPSLMAAVRHLAASSGVHFGASTTGIWEHLTRASNMRWLHRHSAVPDDQALRTPHLLRLYSAIRDSTRTKILVGNALLAKAVILLRLDAHVVVPQGEWFGAHYARVCADVQRAAKQKGGRLLVVTCCGLGAKVLIGDLHRQHPNGIFIDVGSGLDLLCTRKDSRGVTHTYDQLQLYFKPILPPAWHDVAHESIYRDAAAASFGQHLTRRVLERPRVAIFDARIQVPGLVELFPGSDYYVTHFQGRYDLDKTPQRFETLYGFKFREDLAKVTPANYDVLCLVYAVSDFPPKRDEIRHHYNLIETLVSRGPWKRILFFDNHDWDDNPCINPAVNRWAVDHWFKRNYQSTVRYADNVHPFPFAIFGHVCPLWRMLRTDAHRARDPNKLTWAGAVYPAGSRHKGLGRDTLHAALKDTFRTICLPWEQYFGELATSAFALDMNGEGDPNIRTFEILCSNSLLIQQRKRLVWPFDEGDMWDELTVYDTADECKDKVGLLRKYPLVYQTCLDTQQRLRRKYINRDWMRLYLARIARLHF